MFEFPYGLKQEFRVHHRDINVVGRFLGSLPAKEGRWRLNDGPTEKFWVEPPTDVTIDYSFQYKKDSPSRLRLPHGGDFNVEIPVGHSSLRSGTNVLDLTIIDSGGDAHQSSLTIEWDPSPPAIAIDLDDLSAFTSPQEFGQVVNGRWDVDPILDVIRTRGPVAPDSLLLIGPPQGSQEATYQFRYFDGSRSKYIGLSDFFIGHEVERPEIPIKPGWSTAGLATSRPRGEGAWETRLWIARGDRPGWRPSSAGIAENTSSHGVVRTDPAVFFEFAPFCWYNIRHRVEFGTHGISASVKAWPEGSEEPVQWLCSERDPRTELASHATFGLFQHSGLPSEWRKVSLRPLSTD